MRASRPVLRAWFCAGCSSFRLRAARGLFGRDVIPDGTAKVTFSRVPKLDEVPYPVRMEPNLVVEFYSR